MAVKRSESTEERSSTASRLAIVTIATQGSPKWRAAAAPEVEQTLLTCLKKVSASECVCVCELVCASHAPLCDSLKCLPCLANCFGNLFNWPGQIELCIKTIHSDSHQS